MCLGKVEEPITNVPDQNMDILILSNMLFFKGSNLKSSSEMEIWLSG